MLFDNKHRDRLHPKHQGESEYAFYDSSARPEYDLYRALLNGWIGELPEVEQGETISRFRDVAEHGYQAALAELAIHAALARAGHRVEVHPTTIHPKKKPDFLAKNSDGNPVAVVEVTTFGPASDAVARSNREAALYNAIDATVMPAGFRLSYDVVTYGQSSPSANALSAAVRTWAEQQAASYDPEKPPVRLFDAQDWEIELTLFGGFDPNIPAVRAIGGAMGDVRFVKPEKEIRDALAKKGSRYGDFDLPFLIVVADCKAELSGGNHIVEACRDAAFGDVITKAKMNGEVWDERANNGYWGWPDSPKHRNVSGMLVLPKPHLWDLRNPRWQPLMIRNPWTTRPLPDDFLPIDEYRVNGEDLELYERGSFADLLNIPNPWPPEGA